MLGLIGNSGHSTEAHLHFQVARGTAHGAADAWPFQFEGFVLQGTLDENFVIDTTTRSPGPRTDELPLNSDVIDFP